MTPQTKAIDLIGYGLPLRRRESIYSATIRATLPQTKAIDLIGYARPVRQSRLIELVTGDPSDEPLRPMRWN